jgi:Outer membrane protein beta-barrel domain
MTQLADADLSDRLSSAIGDVILKMMKAGILALCVCAAPSAADAQTMQWTDKGYVSVNGGVQVGSHDLTTSSTFTLYDEQATVATTQKVKSGGSFDIGAAYRVWGNNVLAGVTFSHTSSDATVSLDASIPDPVVTDQPRRVTSSQSGAKHSENVIHLNAIWMMPVANKLDVGFFAGPSIFIVKQDTVTDLTVTEPAPTVDAPLNEVSKTTVGFNLGADLQYLIGKKWGVGGLARYSWGSAGITGATKNLTVGGFQIAAGVRGRF